MTFIQIEKQRISLPPKLEHSSYLQDFEILIFSPVFQQVSSDWVGRIKCIFRQTIIHFAPGSGHWDWPTFSVMIIFRLWGDSDMSHNCLSRSVREWMSLWITLALIYLTQMNHSSGLFALRGEQTSQGLTMMRRLSFTLWQFSVDLKLTRHTADFSFLG